MFKFTQNTHQVLIQAMKIDKRKANRDRIQNIYIGTITNICKGSDFFLHKITNKTAGAFLCPCHIATSIAQYNHIPSWKQ